jgi:tRNA pseudouridine38-40 synthase
LSFEAMNSAAAALLGTHDFSCFEKKGGDNKTSVCTVFEAVWRPYVPTHASVMQGLQPPEAFLPSPEKGSGRKAPVGIHNALAHDGSLPHTPVIPSDPSVIPSEAKESYWYFRISADRFLRNMVRAIVGTLIEVGRGKRSVDDFAGLILPPASGDTTSENPRSMAGESVPGHALFLSKVEY